MFSRCPSICACVCATVRLRMCVSGQRHSLTALLSTFKLVSVLSSVTFSTNRLS